MAKHVKTNAMRQLDGQGCKYQIFEYDSTDGHIDGSAVANKIGKGPDQVYKTLVTVGASKQLYVFVIPVHFNLDLKVAARTVDEKRLDMLPVKDLLVKTGYVRGGCSPIGMKKALTTILEASLDPQSVIVSAGKIGFQVEVATSDFLRVCHARLACVSHPE